MKVIDRIEIEYVVPETQVERDEIAAIIRDFEDEKNRPIDLTRFRRVGGNSHVSKKGYWRQTHSASR
jgi:hypothetical protein